MSNPYFLSLCAGAKQNIDHMSVASADIQPFEVGSLGYFPYYWHTNADTKEKEVFNILTYNWINANVQEGQIPIQQAGGSNFTNLMNNALSKIRYKLSTSDQKALDEASLNISQKEKELTDKWEQIYSENPGIDPVINTIVTTWATPATTFNTLLQTNNISSILNTIPTSGLPISPSLNNYIEAINSSTTLVNTSSRATGLLNSTLDALQNPDLANGGLLTTDNKIYPAYNVSTPLSNILKGMQNTALQFEVKTIIKAISDTTISVKIPEYEAFETLTDDFFKIEFDSGSNFFLSLLEKMTEPLALDFHFQGVTLVNFGPVKFNISIPKYWYWISPIVDSIKNGTSDVSGYSFSPNPNINFKEGGPFGLLTGVVISNFPSINIRLKTANTKSLIDVATGANRANISFMDKNENKSKFPYLLEAKKDEDNSVVIACSHMTETSPSVESRAFVHGVQVEYPAAT